MKDRQDLITGLWKFSDKISKEDVAKLGEEFAKDPNYEQLYVRKCSKDQYGLGFTYKYDGTQKGYNDYSEETKDALYKRFGVALAGWDYGSSTIVIKGM